PLPVYANATRSSTTSDLDDLKNGSFFVHICTRNANGLEEHFVAGEVQGISTKSPEPFAYFQSLESTDDVTTIKITRRPLAIEKEGSVLESWLQDERLYRPAACFKPNLDIRIADGVSISVEIKYQRTNL